MDLRVTLDPSKKKIRLMGYENKISVYIDLKLKQHHIDKKENFCSKDMYNYFARKRKKGARVSDAACVIHACSEELMVWLKS